MRTLGLATALAITVTSPAMASGTVIEVPVAMKKGRTVVACPATLPLPGGGTAKVLEANAFANYFTIAYPLPETEDLTDLGPYQLQMDCIYEGGLHLTLEVPGYPVKCHTTSPRTAASDAGRRSASPVPAPTASWGRRGKSRPSPSPWRP
jgi:hypothetical protein